MAIAAHSPAITETLSTLLGPEAVSPWAAVAAPLASALGLALRPGSPAPACVVEPRSQAEVAAVMAIAHQEGWRVLPCGGGSKVTWGGLVGPVDLVLRTTGLQAPIDHAVGDLVVTVGAGVPLATLQAQLAQAGQWVPLDPAYGQRATVGGIVATGDGGALRQRYGGVRDLLIGVSLVRHDGQGAKAGGRVVKNVAGYDLMKLMTGAYGTLGILTSVTLRTYPLGEATASHLFLGTAAAVGELLAAVRRSPLTPQILDLISPQVLQTLGLTTDPHSHGLGLQFQSIAAGVAEQGEAVRAIAASLNLQGLEPPGDFWPQVQASLLPPPGDPEGESLVKVGLLPAHGPALFPWLQGQCPHPWRGRLHGGSGIGYLWFPPDSLTVETCQALRHWCQTQGGYCTLLAAPPALKQAVDPWGIPPGQQRLMARLQAQFDPQGRLSPQRFALGQ